VRRFSILLVLLAGLGAAGVLFAGPAGAHAALVSTTPSSGQRLDRAPGTVTLRFSEPVSVDTGYLRVIDAAGTRVDDGTPEHPGGDPTAVAVPLAGGLPAGGYIVSWQVVSVDSHPVGGAYSFAVGSGALLIPSTAQRGSVDPTVQSVFAVTRWAGFAGLVLLGGAVFLTVCWRDGRTERRPRALVWAGWGAVAGSTALGLLLEGTYGAGTGMGRLLRPTLLEATLRTTYGRMLSVRLVLLAALAVLLARLLREADSPPWREDLAALVGLGVLATYGGAGHAITGIQAPLAVFADTAHLAAMAAWLGGLVLIAACLLRRSDAMSGALPRFSRLAMVAVAVLVVTGTYRSWRDIGSWAAMLGTPYGRIVVVKIALLAGLVLLGNSSRRWVRRLTAARTGAAGATTTHRRSMAQVTKLITAPAGETDATASSNVDGPSDAFGSSDVDGPAPVALLRKSVVAEFALAATVLAFTAVLVAEPPARASFSRPADTSLTLPGGDRVQLSVTPAKAGPNEVHLDVLSPAGQPRDPVSVDAFARLPGTGYDRLPVSLAKLGPGHYVATGVALPAAGRWQLALTVRLSEFDAYVVAAPIEVH
jgi:copper transport protein